MNEDDIDKIVNDKFAEYERDGMIGHDEDGYFIPDRPTTLSDRIARLDEVTYDGYKAVSDWHNNRISEGADPRSGLKSGLGYIPWDEGIDPSAVLQVRSEASRPKGLRCERREGCRPDWQD